ncbi:MBL fold metallo-hydrolase [Fructilactobacillus sp. Tb1]|uniref:MBL fold metallo-hydrolase n=1 Tax=Fructilactobacillus sp. Tb1 TaxID=3422304 RepID=UPI003D29BC6B
MKLTVLGYYGGFPYQNIGTSGYLIQSGDFNLLLDCGSGVLMSLENQLDPLQLNAVVLSHYHADHIADVGVLQYYWQLHVKRYKTSVLPIYGHTLDSINFDKLDWPDSTKKMVFEEGKTSKIGPFELSFTKTVHPVPAFAIRIREIETDKTIVYTADSRYFSGLTDFSKHADLLIADTNFFSAKTGPIWHMTSTEVGTLANDANVKELMISHLPQADNLNELKQETEAAAGKNVKVILPAVGEKIEIS